MQPNRSLVIGTRGSPLALAQARAVAALLSSDGAAPEPEIRTLRTSGDILIDKPLAAFGGKGLFTKEIDEALLSGAVAVAVHSMKDVPTVLPDGIVIAAVLPREDVRDVLVSPGRVSFDDLPHGARVGTSSLRRRAQVLARRNDLAVVDFRGNVNTRLDKIGRGIADATILARAGLNRLGIDADSIGVTQDAIDVLPAPAQGAIGIACRENDSSMRARLATFDHVPTARAIACERALLAALDGSCRTPIAAFARDENARLVLDALIAEPDGTRIWRTRRAGMFAEAEAIGSAAGAEIRAAAGEDFFARLQSRYEAAQR
ncbi:MAG TPA: hydroxymethylbilane synthase [Alphaproteobacteria bacterium]|nr:hydroxymethylbilane synthase [Alphaproteobacteria bacterium]